MSVEKNKKKIQKNYDLLIEASSKTGIHPAWIAGMAIVETGFYSQARAFNSNHLLARAKEYGEQDKIAELKKQNLHIGPHSNGKKTYSDHRRKDSYFERAFKIAPKAAIAATAWGTFQVMGRQLLKIYPDPQKAWSAYQSDPDGVSMLLLAKFVEAVGKRLVEPANKAVDTGDMKYYLITTGIYFGMPVRQYAERVKAGAEIFKQTYSTHEVIQGKAPEPEKKPVNEYKERILFIGDSGTSYQESVLVKKFQTIDRAVKVMYRNGASSRWWHEVLFTASQASSEGLPEKDKKKLLKQKDMAAEIAQYNPTSIRIVTLGGNDACRAINEKDFSNYVSKYVIELANKVDEWGGPPPVGPTATMNCGGQEYNYQKYREIVNKTYKWVLGRVGKRYYDAMATGAYGKVKGNTHHHSRKVYRNAADRRKLEEIKKMILSLQSEILND